MVTVQKGGFWKRISAFLFDVITLSIVVMGIALLLSLAFQYDAKLTRYNEIRTEVEEEYGVSFDIHEDEYNTYDDTKKAAYDAAFDALNGNEEAVRLFSLLVNLSILIVTFSLLGGFLVIEFILPLIFKNGQTLGKKIFGLCVVRSDCVRVRGPILFVRSILGKYAVETMIPAYVIIMILFRQGNILLLALLVLVPLVNLIMVIATKNNCFLHDLLSMTCVADFATQRIFESPEDRAAFIARKEAEEIERQREENAFAFQK